MNTARQSSSVPPDASRKRPRCSIQGRKPANRGEVGRNTRLRISDDAGPLIRTMPMPPDPGGVATAATVSSSGHAAVPGTAGKEQTLMTDIRLFCRIFSTSPAASTRNAAETNCRPPAITKSRSAHNRLPGRPCPPARLRKAAGSRSSRRFPASGGFRRQASRRSPPGRRRSTMTRLSGPSPELRVCTSGMFCRARWMIRR